MSFLFMADAHVKARTWANSLLLSGDAYAALERLGSELDGMDPDARPDTLVIGGDWFDGNRPSSSDLLATMRFLRRFRRVLYIRGNHDSVDPSFLESDLDAGDHSTQCLDGLGLGTLVDGVPVAGLSWRHSADSLMEDILALADGARAAGVGRFYLVLHSAMRHLLGFDGAWQLERSWLEDALRGLWVDILVGDIHVRDTLETSFGAIHSTGSLYPLSTAQMGSGFAATLVDPEAGTMTPVPCDVRAYLRASCGSSAEMAGAVTEAVAGAPTGLPLEPYVELRVDEAGMSRQLPSFGGAAVRLVGGGTAEAEAGDETPQEAELSLSQALAEECGGEGNLNTLAQALLSSDDPLGEIGRWLDGWQPVRAGGATCTE